MAISPRILLKPGKEAPIRRFHPWIFSGAILRTEGRPAAGDLTEVLTDRGEYLATGHYFHGNIALKIISYTKTDGGPAFWKEKLSAALELRRRSGYTDNPTNTAYRLVNSEGDMLPGLIIDYYDGVAVIQADSEGMSRAKPLICGALQEIYGDKLKAVYDKTSEAFVSGESEPVEIMETGHRFTVDFVKGQKTGFFLDQRGNRMWTQFYGKGRSVLNAFCYTGAFSVYAAKGGARSVHSVDSSGWAVGKVNEHMEMNGIAAKLHSEEVADVKKFLTQPGDTYDMIILDPPAFAKHHNITHNALQAYIYINAQAMRRLSPGGILFTFSCSQAISREMFRSAVQAAAIETGKKVRILHHLCQGSDHPVSVFHPEGEYLKGLILDVE